MNGACQGQGGRVRSAKGGLAGGPGAQKAVETFVSLLFSSFRGQNGVGRRLGLWLPWLAGWPTPAQDRQSNEMQKVGNGKINCVYRSSKTDPHRAWGVPENAKCKNGKMGNGK